MLVGLKNKSPKRIYIITQFFRLKSSIDVYPICFYMKRRICNHRMEKDYVFWYCLDFFFLMNRQVKTKKAFLERVGFPWHKEQKLLDAESHVLCWEEPEETVLFCLLSWKLVINMKTDLRLVFKMCREARHSGSRL